MTERIGFPVHSATHTTVAFTPAAATDTELVVEHLASGETLAEERRPLAFGAGKMEIRTHPDASHIACSLVTKGRKVEDARFDVDCGTRIEPIGRYFIVIGAMKAGTTTLYHLLAQHPALCRTYATSPKTRFVKEINYFNRVYRKTDTDLHYDWRFPFDPARHSWTLDVSPNYAKLPRTRNVPRRISALGGKTKLAYILREPIDRIESNLAHKLHKNGKLPKLETCVRTSYYARHLDRFTAHIHRDNILLLDFDQLTRDPAAVQEQVCEFLGIAPFVAQTVAHNVRGVDFKLDAAQRVELAKKLRPDVRILINRYGFEPARQWLQELS